MCIGVHTCLRPKIGDRECAVTSTRGRTRTAGRLCAPRTAQIRETRRAAGLAKADPRFLSKKQKLIFFFTINLRPAKKPARNRPINVRELYSRFTPASSLLIADA